MKMIFKFGGLASLLFASLLLASGDAHAYVYFTRDALIASFFPGREVESVSFTPDRAALKATLGYAPPRTTWEILVSSHADGTPAYALLDEQLGQHEPISFAVLLDADARVERLEVMVYREAYGDGVRAPAFRDQFRGLGIEAPMRPGKDIRIVSGATVSTRALSVGTRRACAVIADWLDG